MQEALSDGQQPKTLVRPQLFHLRDTKTFSDRKWSFGQNRLEKKKTNKNLKFLSCEGSGKQFHHFSTHTVPVQYQFAQSYG
jgi:hypothetical protein